MPESEVTELSVNASMLKDAVDHLTEIAVPLGLRIGVDGDLVQFSFHDPELGWWATTTCRGVTAESSLTHGTPVAVTVPRLVFREAIEFVQLDPSADTTIAVRDGESVQVGATAIAAAQAWPEIPAPPPLTGGVLHPDVMLPRGPWEPDEKVSFTAGCVQLTAPGVLLERFLARDIDRVALHLGDDGAVLVGATHEDEPDDRLVLIVPVQTEP